MLTAAELALMRSTQALALPDMGTVYRATVVSDGMGGQTESWSVVDTQACRVALAGERSAEVAVAERITDAVAWVITFPYDTGILARDRVTVGGRTFEVRYPADTEAWETAREVFCVEVNRGNED